MIRNAAVIGLVLVFLWLTIRIDFVIFAGILLAIFLCKVSERLGRITGLSHGFAVAAVILLITVAAATIGWFFAQSISSQIDQLTTQLPVAIGKVEDQIRQIPWLHSIVQGASPTAAIKAGGNEFGKLFGIAANTFEIIAGFIVLLFVGLYIAAEPEVYTAGLLCLTPRSRQARTRAILDRVIETLWSWMLGRLFSMTVVGICTMAGLSLLGIPLPVALGLLAGMLTFVPYLGSIASAVPALLIAFMIDPQHAVYVVLLYLCVHLLEGYILIPLVQRRAVHVPPALTLSAQVILGVLAGILGIAFAMPLAAALITIVRMAYVEDVLGDDDGPT